MTFGSTVTVCSKRPNTMDYSISIWPKGQV